MNVGIDFSGAPAPSMLPIPHIFTGEMCGVRPGLKPRPPRFLTPGRDRSSAVGAQISFFVEASDVETAAAALPLGLTIDSNSGELHGTITAGAIGGHAVSIWAHDGALSSAPSFQWNVTAEAILEK